MTQPNFLAPSGPVGSQVEWQGDNGMQRAVLGNAVTPGLTAGLIFRPGEPNPSGNVFATWPALYAASLLIPQPKSVFFDNTLAATNIPVGAYDFGENCVWAGLVPPGQGALNRVVVTCPDGVTLTTPLREIADIQLLYTGTHSLMTMPDTRFWKIYVTRVGRVTCSGAGGSVFNFPTGTQGGIFLEDLASVTVSGGGFIWDVAAGAVDVEIHCMDPDTFGGGPTSNQVPVNVLKGAAGPAYFFFSTRLLQVQSAQASMPGGVITWVYTYGATTLSYTPAAPAQWVAPAPTSVQAALDRIAAVVSVGGATPIP